MAAWYGQLHQLHSGAKYDRCGTNNARPQFVAQTKGNPGSEKNESVFDVMRCTGNNLQRRRYNGHHHNGY
jgi:hypothetical protein